MSVRVRFTGEATQADGGAVVFVVLIMAVAVSVCPCVCLQMCVCGVQLCVCRVWCFGQQLVRRVLTHCFGR